MKLLFLNFYGWFKRNSLNLCAIFLCVYLLFISILNIGHNNIKIFFSIIAILLIVIFVLFYNKLKHVYETMIKELTMQGDIQKAKQSEQKLIQLDKWKGYNKSIVLFQSLLLLDQGKWEELSELLHKETQFFHSSFDYLAIYNYLKFKLAYFTGNISLLDEYYLKFNEIMHAGKIKHPLFSCDEVDGIYFYAHHRYKKSLNCFKKIQFNSMNTREQAYVQFELAQTYSALNQIHDRNKALQFVKEEVPQFYIAHLANQKEGIHFEKLA